MTHPNEHPTLPEDLLELLASEGLSGMPKAFAILLNEAMKIERSNALNAAPYQRTDERLGHANGFQAQNPAHSHRQDSRSGPPDPWNPLLSLRA